MKTYFTRQKKVLATLREKKNLLLYVQKHQLPRAEHEHKLRRRMKKLYTPPQNKTAVTPGKKDKGNGKKYPVHFTLLRLVGLACGCTFACVQLSSAPLGSPSSSLAVTKDRTQVQKIART